LKPVIILGFLFGLLCAAFPNVSSAGGTKSIKWEDGIAFVDGKAKYLDPKKLSWPDLFKTKNEVARSRGVTVQHMMISFSNDGGLETYYSKKKRRYLTLPEDNGRYQYMVANESLYLRPVTNNWSPVTIWCPLKVQFLGYIDETPVVPHSGDEPDPCMRLQLSCPWFSGEYELMCAPYVDEEETSGR